MRLWILFFLTLFLCTACNRANHGGPKKFLLPWADSSGHYSLQVVTLTTLPTPFELKGDAAEIYFQSSFGAGGFEGSIAHPHLTQSGDLYVPQDSETAIALGVYAQMEQLYLFEKKLGFASQLNWPRKVGVELNVVGSDQDAHDNAHYYGDNDVIGVLPYDQRGVPLSLNHGVIAHEHFHSHFQHEVIDLLGPGLSTMVSLLENIFYPTFGLKAQTVSGAIADEDPKKAKTLNSTILRAWNEGLADLFAGIYTGQASFFGPSLKNLAAARDLSAPVQKMWVSKDYTDYAGKDITADDLEDLAYFQGTVMARALYQMSLSGAESQEQFLVRLMENLKNIPLTLDTHKFETEVMNGDQIFFPLLDGMPLNAVSCKILRATADPNMYASFKQCLNF